MIDHVLIIPDGNRRYARAKNISEDVVYKFIADSTTTNVVKFFLFDKKIETLTIFGISRDNVLKRERSELQGIYDAQLDIYEKWLSDKEISSKIKFQFIGDKKLLPEEYQNKMNKLEALTKNNKSGLCNILVAYNGQWEIIEAAKKAMEQKKELTIENCYDFLEIKTPIDIVIRTGFEKRFSGCPLYQTSYSEFFFADFHYPELTVERLSNILEDFKKRERRFGK